MDEVQITVTGTVDQILDFARRLKKQVKPVNGVVTTFSGNQPVGVARYNKAWKMVVDTNHSIRYISGATGVSKSTISNMRSALSGLRMSGETIPENWK